MTYSTTCKWLLEHYANVARYARDLGVKELCCDRIIELKERENDERKEV